MRTTAGFTGRGLAGLLRDAGLRMTPEKLSKIEHGRQMPKPEEIRAWAEACGASERAAEDLVGLLADARSVSLNLTDKLSGGQEAVQSSYVELLAGAERVAFWLPDLIPGPLQIPGYARAVLATAVSRFGADQAEDLDAAVAARLQGAQYLYRGKQITVVIGEPALRWHQCDNPTMRAQLHHLASALDLPGLWLGIVPLDVRLPVLLPPNFALYDQVGQIETLFTEQVFEGSATDIWWEAVADLQALAVTGDDARKLITAAAKRLS